MAGTEFNEFRGICIAEGKCEGKWVYGNLIRSKDWPFPKWYIHPLVQRVSVEKHVGKIVVMHEVDPNTIGQYIGRTDDNGKKLYNNQRVKFRNLCTGSEWAEGFISYDTKAAGFYIRQSQDDEAGWNIRYADILAIDEELNS